MIRYLLSLGITFMFLLVACDSQISQDSEPPTPAMITTPTVITLPSQEPIAPPAAAATATTQTTTMEPTSSTTPPSPTSPPSDYSTWTTYHNTNYGFSFRYPDERWEVVEWERDENLVSLAFHELAIVLRIHFKRSGEDIIISQDAAGAPGDRVPKGEVVFIGQPIERTSVVYQGLEHEVHYDDARDITRGDLAFAIFLRSNRSRLEDKVLPEAVQEEADRILESFELD